MSFKHKVYSLVRAIPKKRVTTYKQIALKLNIKAYRAVGTALNKNRDYKNVPCHRVVCSNGFVGFYNKGLKNKIKLLRREGINIGKNKKINFKKYLFTFN